MLIGAWCRLAASLGRYGERRGHAHFTNKALEQYDAIPRDSRLRERSALSLDIAEEMLYGDSYLPASRLISNYSDVTTPVRDQGVEGRKRESRYAAVSGLLEERRGNKARAEEAYRRAFEIDHSIGLIRSAAIVAYRLFVLTGDPQYEAFIEEALRGASDKYWVKSRLLKGRTEARLTPRQLEVVQLVARGLSNKEVGNALKITEARVRNILVVLFRTLGVHSRAELANLATERGLLQ